MVKGISRQVIVVRQPDRRFFEQAIFIVKEEALGQNAQQVLEEARRAADGYVRRSALRPARPWMGLIWAAAAGAAAASGVWGLVLLLLR